MKAIKVDIKKWNDIPCSWIGRLNIKMSILFNLIYRVYTISVNISTSCFTGMNKLILKFMWKVKQTTINNIVLKKNKVGGLTSSDFKTYYKTTIFKPACMPLVKEYTHRSMKQNKEPRNRSKQNIIN